MIDEGEEEVVSTVEFGERTVEEIRWIFRAKINQVERIVEEKMTVSARRKVFRWVKIFLLLCGNQTAQKRSKAMQTINQLEQHVNAKSKNPRKENVRVNFRRKIFFNFRRHHVFDTKMMKDLLIRLEQSFQTIGLPQVSKEQTNPRQLMQWSKWKPIVFLDP